MFPHFLFTFGRNEGLFWGDVLVDSARGDRRGEVLLPVLSSLFWNGGYKLFAFFIANKAISTALSFNWFSLDFWIVSGEARPRTNSSSSAWRDKIRMRRRYHSINFSHRFPNKRHLIARPWGRGMRCLLLVQILIHILHSSLRCCIWYFAIFDHVKWRLIITRNIHWIHCGLNKMAGILQTTFQMRLDEKLFFYVLIQISLSIVIKGRHNNVPRLVQSIPYTLQDIVGSVLWRTLVALDHGEQTFTKINMTQINAQSRHP